MNNLLVEGYSENTLRDYYYDLRSLCGHIENPTNVTTKELKHYLLHLRQKHDYCNASIARRVAFLRTFYRFLVEEDIRKDNPSLSLRFPRVREKPIPFLSEHDIQRILSVIHNTRDKLIIKILFLEGLRKDELLKLQKKHFDFNNKTILIQGKGAKQRIIPLCNELCSDLTEYVKEMSSEDCLFPLTLVGTFSKLCTSIPTKWGFMHIHIC